MPRSTSTEATGPRPGSRLASSTNARPGAFGFAMSGGSWTSATRRMASSSSGTPVPSVPDTSTTSVSPPHSSGTSSCSTSCWRVRLADSVEQGGLAVVDVAHHGYDGRARLEEALVLLFLFVVAEQRPELELFLLARLDQQHLGAEGLADELDHLVRQRLRSRDHLAGVEQHAHEVGGGPVQLGRELLD